MSTEAQRTEHGARLMREHYGRRAAAEARKRATMLYGSPGERAHWTRVADLLRAEEATRDTEPPEPLTEAQREGFACTRCHGETGPMVPAGMVDGSQVFAHPGCLP